MLYLWFENAFMPAGWASHVRISIEKGVIVTIAIGVPASPQDDCHTLALPGLCNVHSHAFQRGMAGLSEYRGEGGGEDNFWSWREVMYRFLDRLDPDDVEAITAQAYVEMLEAGYTRVGEFHYLHHDPQGAPYANIAEMAERVHAAAAESGIGLTLLPVFYAHSNFGGKAPTHGQRRFINDLDRFERLLTASHALLRKDDVLGVAPHSLRAVTAQELAALQTMRPAAPFHIHAAEQMKEVEDCVAHYQARPIAWLLDNTAVDARWCFVHATQINDAECNALAVSSAVVGLCPITEANLGDGIFPAQRFLEAGGRIGIGSDSNIAIDTAQEIRALEYSQRLSQRSRNVLAGSDTPSTGTRLFNTTLAGGAQALGVQHGLCVGAPADIIALNSEHPALYGRDAGKIIDSWLFAGDRSCIDSVWRAGERLVSNGHHVKRAAIAARYRRTLKKIL